MFSNCFTYERIAEALKPILEQSVIADCFSTGKDEIIFHFSIHNHEKYQLNIKILSGELIYRFNGYHNQFGNRCIRQFRDAIGHTVVSVKSVPFERILEFKFENGRKLIFQGFGRFGNIVFIDENKHIIDSFKPARDQVFQYFVKDLTGYFKSGEFPDFITDEMKDYLNLNGWNSADYETRHTLFQDLISYLKKSDFYLDSNSDPPVFSYFKGPGKASLGKGLDAINDFSSTIISRTFFIQEKGALERKLVKDLKHFERLKKDNESKLKLIQERRNYKELGDIILTYAHKISPRLNSAFLPDYYTGEQIRVKLDPNLNATENAAKYYKKAKNESIEINNIEKNIQHSTAKISELNDRLKSISSVNSIRELKNIANLKMGDTLVKPSHKSVEFNGFKILIGKNAKDNDNLLRQSNPNDLWLHARNVTGSHVIIKRSGNTFPEAVVEYAAKLAAMNSRAKHHSVVPVIVTERKYVIKNKFHAPGEVRLIKEKTIDVFLEAQ